MLFQSLALVFRMGVAQIVSTFWYSKKASEIKIYRVLNTLIQNPALFQNLNLEPDTLQIFFLKN